MNFELDLKKQVSLAVKQLFQFDITPEQINTNFTIKEFEGDITILVFPLVKISKLSPEETGKAIGGYLLSNCDYVSNHNTVKGFLNIVIKDQYWLNFITEELPQANFGKGAKKEGITLLEYCGPNTNKPLHIGHLRNMFIGFSVANILKETGREVVRININNDRGIAICKSMISWQKWGNGATPDSTHTKGDHFVGDYYVLFEKENKKLADVLIASGADKDKAKNETTLMKETQEMLLKWENGDPEIHALWKQMNDWVYSGFRTTWKRLGIVFEKEYYESIEYIKGKNFVLDGLEKGVFYKKENGAICTDLTSYGLDEKVLLRGDGSSIYLTQDLGMIHQRYEDYKMNQMIYVVADEQNYHFKVLQLVLKQLQMPYADGLFHLSYGMVDLPQGRMKTREGNVVDADDLIDEVVKEAGIKSKESGKVDDLSKEAQEKLFENIGLAAIKYYILKVNPKNKILFNPAESVDLQGDTGPFIQYSYARIQSILRKSPLSAIPNLASYPLNALEKEIIVYLYKYPSMVQEAAENYNPSLVSQYVFHLAKLYNRFYAEYKIIAAELEEEKNFRIYLSQQTGNIIKRCLNLLGIDVVERM